MKYGVIAGSNSGLAIATRKKLIEDGYTLFCGDIAYSTIKVEGNEHFVPLDVTDNTSLISFRDYVSSFTQSISLISSFCGIVTLGSFVELDLSSLEKIMKINLNAPFALNNLFFPFLEKGKGRIINISSEYARIPAFPIHGYYPLSKHALDFYNDSLRRELSRSNVKVIAIRPGAFKTNMQGGIEESFTFLFNNTKRYKSFLNRLKPLMDGELKKAKDASVFASTYMKALKAKKPKRYYNVKNSFKMRLLSLLPPPFIDLIFSFFLR